MLERMKAALRKYLFLEGVGVGVIVCHIFYRQIVVRRIDEGYAATVKMLQAEETERSAVCKSLNEDLNKLRWAADEWRRRYLFERVLESLPDLPATDVADAILGGVKKLGGPLDASEFVRMLRKAPENVRERIVIGCAPFVELWDDDQAQMICELLPPAERETTLEMLRDSKLRAIK
jgi:hypothetical protein